ncbi:hypothetical protein [Streptomyces triticisoli]|uniref:hypothetical protein n=1 Tax=Streptomyces triticisoli TaxID=2182797 RepID=UPI000DD77783|nr:hypothetical protein [Streptomyces triticisoli]
MAFLLLLTAVTRAGRSHRRLLAARAARVPGSNSPTARARQELHETCCLSSWESHGTIHDARMRTRGAAARRPAPAPARYRNLLPEAGRPSRVDVDA